MKSKKSLLKVQKKGGHQSITVSIDPDEIENSSKSLELKLTAKEKLFCEKYIEYWDYEKAFEQAGYTSSTKEGVRSSVVRLRTRSNVWAYLKFLQRDTEKVVGINRKDILNMHKEIIDTSIGHLHKSWIERVDFDNLTPAQKACIQEIDSKTITKKGKTTHYVKIKLYDRQKSMDAITKLLGYDEPDRLEINGNKELISAMFPFGK